MPALHHELHRSARSGWLRAAVLGANDGTISVASLVVGVAAAGSTASEVLITGLAGLVAGATSMAAGEYVSVKSQADIEGADLERERQELAHEPSRELAELTAIYAHRGLSLDLARQVAEALMSHDALGAHARDELGLTDTLRARPLQAAFASAAAFAVGASIPIASVLLAPAGHITTQVCATTLIALLALGAIAARVGGASVIRGALRVVFWGALAMALTAAAGLYFGASV